MKDYIYNLWHKEQRVMFNVRVNDDYKVPATFDHDSPSDLDYFGYRETDFTVVAAWQHGDDRNYPHKMSESEIAQFVERECDLLELIVQDKLDELNGEYNE
jgi:hypothetical protein